MMSFVLRSAMSHIPQKMITGIQNSKGIGHLTNRFTMLFREQTTRAKRFALPIKSTAWIV
jgi:hypothetical protein